MKKNRTALYLQPETHVNVCLTFVAAAKVVSALRPSNTNDVIMPHQEIHGITLRCSKQFLTPRKSCSAGHSNTMCFSSSDPLLALAWGTRHLNSPELAGKYVMVLLHQTHCSLIQHRRDCSLWHAVVQREELAQDDAELRRDAARKLAAVCQRL